MTSRYDESETFDESESTDTRVVPERTDKGKNVIGANGRDIGMVTTVVGDTMYVAPNTRVSEPVERKLEWNDKRNSPHPIPPEIIVRIDDEVLLAVEREAE